MKTNIYRYFVEGECEEKLVNTLKEQNNIIFAGKVDVFNVIQNEFTSLRIRTIPEKSIIILVFDTDKKDSSILRKNIDFLRKQKRFKEILCITQVENLEDELLRSTTLKHITDLTNSTSINGFKNEFIKEKNLYRKLEFYNFDISKIWETKPPKEFDFIVNSGKRIKIK